MREKIKIKYILSLVVIILFIILFFCIKNIYDTLKSNGEVKTLSIIEEYGYTLNENDSPYFKELFSKLKECLEEENIDEEKYATLVSQLFITDFYSLEYAISKSDVGGVQFIYIDGKDKFINKAKDTVYASVESNIYGKRKQELPNIKEVKLKDINQDLYKGKQEMDENAYFVDLEIIYDVDLDYPNEVSLILIHKDNKLQIAEIE